MKKLTTLLATFMVLASLYAQNTPTNGVTEREEKSDRFGQGTRKTIQTTTKSNGTVTILETFYDAKGDIQQEIEIYRDGTRLDSTIVWFVNKEVFAKESRWYRDGVLDYESRVFYKDDKKVKGFSRGRVESGWEIRRYDSYNDKWELLKPTEKPPAPISFGIMPVDEGESENASLNACNKPDLDIFIAYSYLTNFQEGEDLALALGGHLAVTYLLNKRIGLVADFSYHTKEENDLRIVKMYLMGGAQLMLYQIQMKRQKEFLMYVRLLAGLAQDRLKFKYGGMSATDKYKAFSAAAGLGFMYQIGNAMLLSLLTDYIHTRFNDEGQSGIRASLGLTFLLGCKK
jgi:hypothetical protein